MKQFTTRSPCLILTHSRWRGDFSSRSLAQSWAVAVTAASSAATTSNSILRFIGFLFGFGLLIPGRDRSCHSDAPRAHASDAPVEWGKLAFRASGTRPSFGNVAGAFLPTHFP